MAVELQDSFLCADRTLFTGSILAAVLLEKSALPQLAKFSPRFMEPEAPPAPGPLLRETPPAHTPDPVYSGYTVSPNESCDMAWEQ